MKTRNALAALIAAGQLAACSMVGSVKTSGELGSQPGVVLPPLTPNLEASVETLAGSAGSAATALFYPKILESIDPATATGAGIAAAAAVALLYVVYDPLAPNWTIKEQPLAPETYRLFLRAKNFRTGGDGESLRIVKRRAEQLQREKGYTAYRLLDYTEGIESATPFSYRVSEGTVQLVKAP